MDIKTLLCELSSRVSVGNISEADDYAAEYLSKYAKTYKSDNGAVIATLKGKSDYTLMLDAHIDEVAFVVTGVDGDGFVTVNTCGGIDIRTLPAKSVTIHSKQKVTGVFCSIPPHLSPEDTDFEHITDFKIDSMLQSKAKEIISVGDFVTFNTKPYELLNGRLSGKSFDDRAGCTVLLELAKRLSKKELPFNVTFVLSDMEELGLRGAKTASYEVSPNEAIAIDVSFGDAPDVSSDDCGKLSNGAMIGISPVLDKAVTNKLFDIAKQNSIPYQSEVMGRSTGTNSDIISVNKSGVKTGLVSIPIRNMHTDNEVIDVADIESVCDLLEKYILSRGVMNV